MIKIKNVAEYTENLRAVGAAAQTTGDKDSFIAPAAGYIKAIVVAAGVMGTDGTGAPTQDYIADVKKNGTSIFSGATKFNFSHAKEVGTANTPILPDNIGALSSTPVAVAKGDRITLNVAQILNGTSPVQPQDLNAWIVFTRGNGWSPEATLLGQLSELDN